MFAGVQPLHRSNFTWGKNEAIGDRNCFRASEHPVARSRGAYGAGGDVGSLEEREYAFTLNPGVDTGCQVAGQFILNASEPGTRNQLAVLITAKASRKQVQVYIRSCGAAAGYGGDYAIPEYLYLLD